MCYSEKYPNDPASYRRRRVEDQDSDSSGEEMWMTSDDESSDENMRDKYEEEVFSFG